MHKLLRASLALALTSPLAARADTTADIQALRDAMQALRTDYQVRMEALEQRLKALESGAAAPTAAAAAAPEPAPALPPPSAPSGPPVEPAPGAAAAAANAFNPAVSLILSGLYTNTSQDPAHYAITGFPLPPSVQAGPGDRGFSLAESELGLAASIDPWFRGAANIAFHPDDTVSVEEAFVQTTALGNGFGLKAGRFFSGIGYLNPQHSHTWDFVDSPLAYQAFLGGQYGDDGLQATWLAPTDQFIEIGAEVGRGRNFPGSDTARNGAGMGALTAHTGGDIGDSHSWRAGLSLLDVRATELPLSDGETTRLFTGTSRVWVADAVWKWAPHGNATRTSFKLQGEWLQSTRDGTLGSDSGSSALHLVQSGGYLQGVYQFLPRWRVGLRTERLNAGDDVDYHPSKQSLMFDFSPSEFSRVRLQLARDLAHEGAPDNQLFLQYQMSLGAHGAHSF
jgi:hypothetical protein